MKPDLQKSHPRDLETRDDLLQWLSQWPAVKAQLSLVTIALHRKQIVGSISCAKATIEVLRNVVGNCKFASTDLLMTTLRIVGLELLNAAPSELVIGNVVRRVLFLIREEYATKLRTAQSLSSLKANDGKAATSARSTDSLLNVNVDANPNFNRDSTGTTSADRGYTLPSRPPSCLSPTGSSDAAHTVSMTAAVVSEDDKSDEDDEEDDNDEESDDNDEEYDSFVDISSSAIACTLPSSADISQLSLHPPANSTSNRDIRTSGKRTSSPMDSFAAITQADLLDPTNQPSLGGLLNMWGGPKYSQAQAMAQALGGLDKGEKNDMDGILYNNNNNNNALEEGNSSTTTAAPRTEYKLSDENTHSNVLEQRSNSNSHNSGISALNTSSDVDSDVMQAVCESAGAGKINVGVKNLAGFPEFFPGMRQSVIAAINELTDELDNVYGPIAEQAQEHIHSDECVLVYGHSTTIEMFLKAAGRKRKFSVIVAEAAPALTGCKLANSLASIANITVALIPDSSVYAIMSRVHKVLFAPQAVMAAGGSLCSSGHLMVAVAAKDHSVPVVAVTDAYAITPIFAHDKGSVSGQLQCPASMIAYNAQVNFDNVQVYVPEFDHVSPELIDLYVTSIGSHQPSYIYRLLSEFYHPDDYEL